MNAKPERGDMHNAILSDVPCGLKPATSVFAEAPLRRPEGRSIISSANKKIRAGAGNSKGRLKKRHSSRFGKGVTQIDYIVAAGMFILVFALVVQFVSNYFSNIGEKAGIRVMNGEATSLLDVAERGFEPEAWPYFAPNSSVVLLMHLDNSTLDSSLYGRNGTITGANCSAAVSGRLDSACSFDGINDYINTGSNGLGEENASFTVAAWINVASSTPSWKTIIDENVCSGFDLAVNGLSIIAGRNCGQGNGFTVSKAIGANAWYHVALTYNGSTLSLYVNGAFEDSDPVNIFIHGGSFCIGSYTCTGGENFNGTIDEVIVWNRSLSAGEIYDHYAYESLLDRIGLMTKAYRFYMIVNNSAPYWRNQSLPVEDIASERVVFNYTELGYGADVPSTVIYEENGSVVPYSISGNSITFSTAIAAGSVKHFTVFFDDDSNFAERTGTITGVDNLTETTGHIQAFPIIQYRKLLFLNNSNYLAAKNATGLPRGFNIKVVDTGTSANILDFGPAAPPSGNVVALQRYTMYQNSTGHIRRGRLVIQTW